ncbi:MAG: class I SAM-dependent methyltransferase [Acidimicrobiaceae bacterium]|nr:class I SAM-dependent methyltransferase [Acidimicrobiaceae bacterium]
MTSERGGAQGMDPESDGFNAGGGGDLPLITVGAEVDAGSLLAEIQREVERKKEAGLYPPALMTGLELADDPLEWALDGLVRSSRLQADPGVWSPHRFVGGASASVKRILRRGLRWYTRWLVDQLSNFGGAVVNMSAALKERDDDQQSAIEELQAELAAERARVQHQLTRINRRLEPLLKSEVSRSAPPPQAPNGQADSVAEAQGALSGIDMADFWDRLRPRQETVRSRSLCLDYFRRSPGRVLDLGCGGGDFLALLREAGVDAYGVDANPDMVDRCQEKGLSVSQEDPIAHLGRLVSGTLGGVCAAGIVEHLEPAAVVRLFQLAAEVLTDGGILVIETLNPERVATFTNAAYAGLMPARPIHPTVLTCLAEGAGFRNIEVRDLQSRNDGLAAQPPPAGIESVDPLLQGVIEELRRIDEMLFGGIDLAFIARR